MTVRASLICALAVVAGCAGRPAMRPGADFDSHSEKAVFTALRQVHATDEQRIAIMAAYDDSQPRLVSVNDQADEVIGKWRELDRRDPGFAKKSAELADKWGKLSKERMALTGKFDGAVAGILKADQWDAWQLFWLRPGFSPENGPPEEQMGRRRD